MARSGAGAVLGVSYHRLRLLEFDLVCASWLGPSRGEFRKALPAPAGSGLGLKHLRRAIGLGFVSLDDCRMALLASGAYQGSAPGVRGIGEKVRPKEGGLGGFGGWFLALGRTLLLAEHRRGSGRSGQNRGCWLGSREGAR